MFQGIIEVMVFVEEPGEAARWYSRLFGIPLGELEGFPDALFIRAGRGEIWFHASGEKMPSGAAGQVVYWRVDDFDKALEKAVSLGATLYRGPLDRLDGEFMCQVKDPFGNLLGLVGPRGAGEK